MTPELQERPPGCPCLVLPRRVLLLTDPPPATPDGPGGTQQRPLFSGYCLLPAQASGEPLGRQDPALHFLPVHLRHPAQGLGICGGKKRRETREAHGGSCHGIPRPVEGGKSPPITAPPGGQWDPEPPERGGRGRGRGRSFGTEGA